MSFLDTGARMGHLLLLVPFADQKDAEKPLAQGQVAGRTEFHLNPRSGLAQPARLTSRCQGYIRWPGRACALVWPAPHPDSEGPSTAQALTAR